jgi:DNA-binding NarL/FixJ family response regulator
LALWRRAVPTRIHLADDHLLVRQGLKALLEREGFTSAKRCHLSSKDCRRQYAREKFNAAADSLYGPNA